MRTRRGLVRGDSDVAGEDSSHQMAMNEDNEASDLESSLDDNSDDDSYDEEEEYETNDDEEESNLVEQKTLLFLCQEGQIRLARRRLQMLQEDENKPKTLQKEIFQSGHDKNYPMHEVIMGGTLEESSKNIVPEIVQIAKEWKGQCVTMLNAQPPSHGRTTLHWAAWGNASLEILRLLTFANPEALVLRDNKKSGSRTPLEILKRYHPIQAAQKISFLESSTKLWTEHRLRLALYKASLYWFCKRKPDVMVPFERKSRKETGITPKNWFLLSVLGYCLQREMEPLLWRILNFVGGNAKIARDKSRKRKRS